MKRSRGLVGRALFVAAMALVPVAVCGEARAQDEEALMEARAKFQRAIELEHAGNYAGALKLFREVGQAKMTPQVRYHIATCEEKLGQLVAALGGYELALAQAEGMHPDFISEVEGAIEQLRGRIPKLVIERGEGAEAASVELDGVALGASSLGQETPLNPGPHTVEASAPGYEPFRETVTVSEGAVETLSINLTPLPKGAPPPDDGAATPGEEKSFGMLPYIIGGAGIGVAAVGGVFIGISQGKAGKVKDQCGGVDCSALTGTERDEAEKTAKSARTFEAVGWIGVGVGVAALATGTVMFVIDRGRKSDDGAVGFQLLPAAPSSDAGLSFVGRF